MDFETKPEAIMFGSFAKHQFEMREKPSLPPRQRHNSAHRGTHRGAFVNNTVDRIKMQFLCTTGLLNIPKEQLCTGFCEK